jgi:hypothetical protein
VARRVVFRGFKRIAQTRTRIGIALLPLAGVAHDFVYRCFAPNERAILADLPEHKRHANAQDTFISKFLQGCCERFQSELFKKGILAGKRVIDIGAHVGWVQSRKKEMLIREPIGDTRCDPTPKIPQASAIF